MIGYCFENRIGSLIQRNLFFLGGHTATKDAMEPIESRTDSENWFRVVEREDAGARKRK